MSGVIEHLCASPEHQPAEDAASPVIIYANKWGYCPAGAADGHDWRATGGRTLATVREWLGRPPMAAPVPDTTRLAEALSK
jgi:hypothetical protein